MVVSLGTQWRFIPPADPQTTFIKGIWEAAIKEAGWNARKVSLATACAATRNHLKFEAESKKRKKIRIAGKSRQLFTQTSLTEVNLNNSVPPVCGLLERSFRKVPCELFVRCCRPTRDFREKKFILNIVFRNSEHLGNAAATFQPPQDPRRDPETENLRALRHSVAASEPFRAVRPENRGTTMFYAIVFVSLLAKSTLAEPLLRTCEPIRVDLCMGLGYNMTGMPNLGGNDVQQEADYNLKSYSPLIQYGCSQQLKLFLCSVYVPMCTEKVANPIGPCRGLCESVRSRCYPVLQGFGFSWPDALNCSRFPVENNHEHMCMEGPKEKVDIRAPVEPAVRKFDCSPHGLRNGLPDCNPSPCGADNMFDESEKRIAEVWITVWALACIAASLGSLLTLALGGGRVRAPPLLGLSLCYLLVGAGWALRSFAGPTGGSCRIPSPTGLKTDDGLPNVICAFVFLLLYYFGMAANAWWVCLCAWWVARAGFSWTPEKMRSLTTILNVCTWGFPAAQTVAALVQRNVDSDELTGTCYIGNKNLSTLWNLVLVPYFLYFCTGALLLTLGWILVLKGAKLAPLSSATAPLTQGPPRKERNFLGALATLYAVPIFLVMASFFVEYNSRERWLVGQQRPSVWFFLLLRHFMSLFIGISSILWIWCSKSAQVWKSALKRLGPRSQPSKNAPVLKYPLAHHPGLIVPGNLYNGSRQSSRAHSHRKTSRNHHLRSGSETII